MKPLISFPLPVAKGIHVHNTVYSFRGLCLHWARAGLVDVQFTENPFVWWGEPGTVLLYDWDTLEHLTENVRYKVGLFGNPDPPFNGKVNLPWTYWPRCSKTMRAYRTIKPLSFKERRCKSIFIGGYENWRQRGFRPSQYWRPVVEHFSWCIRRESYSASEYARLLRGSRYGLCLRGNGGKCHREIELMATGCVPILTPEVNLSYRNPLVLGRHYLLAGSAEEFRELVETVSEEQWTAMSKHCLQWFDENASVEGSFAVTKSILEDRA